MAGFDLGLSGISNSLAGAGATTVTFLFYGMIMFLVLCGVGFFIWRGYEKKTYCVPVTLYKLREDVDPTKGEIINYMENPFVMGGVIKQRNGVKTFKLKVPKQFFKSDIGYVPDPRLVGADNRVHLIQSSDGTLYQQIKKSMVAYTETIERVVNQETGEVIQEQVIRRNLLLEPISTDVKTHTINSINSFKDMIDRNKMTIAALSITALIIIAIVFVVAIYFQTHIKCPVLAK